MDEMTQQANDDKMTYDDYFPKATGQFIWCQEKITLKPVKGYDLSTFVLTTSENRTKGSTVKMKRLALISSES